jgi:hypothetical protein
VSALPREDATDASPPDDTGAISAPADSETTTPASAGDDTSAATTPPSAGDDSNADTAPAASRGDTESPDRGWVPLPPSHVTTDNSVE